MVLDIYKRMSLTNRIRNSSMYAWAMEAIPSSVRPQIREVLYKLTSLYDYGRLDMFTNVAIETTSICNRNSCIYCPNSNPDLRKKRPQKHMDKELYKKIIWDLTRIGYEGKIALEHYGEPLNDPNLDERINLANIRLPKAEIRIHSNGDYLTPKRFEALIKAGIDCIFVTNHNPNGRLHSSLEKLQKHLEQHPEKRRYYHLRTGVQSPCNRGGLVEIPEEKVRKIQYCINESHTLNIDIDGNVLLCCNDYLGHVVLGNLAERNIMEVWDSSRFKRLRKEKKKGIFTEDICKKCSGQ